MSRSGRRVWWSVALLSLLAVGGALGLRLYTPERARGSAEGDEDVETVHVAEARRGALTLHGKHAGELDADVAEIATQTSGLLKEVRVRIGDHVEEGDLLARVDAGEVERQIVEARAQVRIAEASSQRVEAELGAARAELSRTEPLAADRLVSAQELDALQARVRALEAQAMTAQAQREQAEARIAVLRDAVQRARLLAPFEGAVAERYLDPGAVVQPGTRVLRLVRSGPLRVRFRVPERDVGRVSVGMPLEVTTQATGDQRHAGEVTRLSAEISRDDRSLAVEGTLQERAEGLRPGGYAQVRLSYDTLRDAVLIPARSLVERVDADGTPHRGAYVVAQGRASWRALRVQGRSGSEAAVEGLEAGERVVTLGHEALHDGVRVRIEAGS